MLRIDSMALAMSSGVRVNPAAQNFAMAVNSNTHGTKIAARGLRTWTGCFAVDTSLNQEGKDVTEELRAYVKNSISSGLVFDNLMPRPNIRQYQDHAIFDFSQQS